MSVPEKVWKMVKCGDKSGSSNVRWTMNEMETTFEKHKDKNNPRVLEPPRVR